MKPINTFVSNLHKQILKQVQLDQKSTQQLIKILSCLKEPLNKSRQELLLEVTQNLALTDICEYKLEPILTIIYRQYFMHFDLVKLCGEQQARREHQLHQDDMAKKISMYIELPYIAKSLKQAKQVNVTFGTRLDPSYIN